MRILWFHFVKSRQMVQYLFLIEQCPTAITMPKVKIGHLMSFHILSKFIIHKSPIIQCYQPGTLKTVLTSEPNIHFFNILKYPLQNIIYNRFQVQQIPLFCLRMCKRSVKYPRPFVSFAVKHFCTKEECYSSLYIWRNKLITRFSLYGKCMREGHPWACHEGIWESWVIVSFVLNLSSRSGKVVSFTVQLLYPLGNRTSGTHWIQGCVGSHSSSGSFSEDKSLSLPGSGPQFLGSLACNLVIVPIMVLNTERKCTACNFKAHRKSSVHYTV
jgi:hypothetical protein